MPPDQWAFFRERGGKPFPEEQVAAGKRDLQELVHILQAEGITVRRPESVDHTRPYATPHWRSESGLYAAMPRDVLLVFGDELIEAPMAWRSRYFEIAAYRPLLREYFERGARWTSPPKPLLEDDFYAREYREPSPGEPLDYVISEKEPTFDAADFIRCGQDMFVQRSHCTNAAGIEWLRRHLGGRCRVHEVEVHDTKPMHIDATLMPLAPGKVLVNPERIKRLPELFRTWDVLYPPEPSVPEHHPMFMSSRWVSMNLLMLDEERVVVERHEEALARKLKDWGLRPIPCSFQGFYSFGGSFHCATLDVRRRGTLRSYF
jgi:glycine amidinotransferase